MDVGSWNEDDVTKWLTDNGFGDYTKNFSS